MHQSTPLPQQSDEFVQSHDRDRTEEKSVKFPSMEGDVSTQDASSRQSLARIAATAASRAETAAVAEDQRARTARSGQVSRRHHVAKQCASFDELRGDRRDGGMVQVQVHTTFKIRM